MMTKNKEAEEDCFQDHNASPKRNKALYILPIIFILSVALYWRMLDNFFSSDDFEWLNQVKSLEQRPSSIFNPVVHPPAAQATSLQPNYFTPLIHIVFWLNYKAFGLDPFGYHLFGLILHIVNSYLVVYFIFLLCNSLPLAILVGLFFTSNFAVSNAVVWPSAYVDTVMFTFYISSLTAFISFLKKGHRYYYAYSIIFYILSIASKGTALTLPLVLLLTEKYYKSKIHLRELSKHILFIFISLVYLVLLFNKNTGAPTLDASDLYKILLNASKVPMTLLIPEGLLPVNGWLVLLLLVVFSALLVLLIKRDGSGFVYFGMSLLLIGVSPLFIMHWNFPADPNPLTESISHRLYLGNLGYAMLIGLSVHSCYVTAEKRIYNFLIIIMTFAFIGYNVYWNQRIQYKWDKESSETVSAINEIKDLLVKYPRDTSYGFINFPPRQHFGDRLFKLLFEPYDMQYGIWPLPPHVDRSNMLFIIQLNGHIYIDPELAAKRALTPWDHFFVAHYYLLLGNKEKGLTELEKATTSMSDEKLHYFAAITYEKMGFINKAIEELKKVSAINECSIYTIYANRTLKTK